MVPALTGTRFELAFGFVQRRQPVFAAGNLLRHVQSVRQIPAIIRFGECHSLLDLFAQRLVDLLQMTP